MLRDEGEDRALDQPRRRPAADARRADRPAEEVATCIPGLAQREPGAGTAQRWPGLSHSSGACAFRDHRASGDAAGVGLRCAPGMTSPWPVTPSRRSRRSLSRPAADRGRALRDRRGRHPLQGPHRRAARRCSTRARRWRASSRARNARRRRSIGAARSSRRRQGAALVVNSGNANAFTGKNGREAARLTAEHRRAGGGLLSPKRSSSPRPA